MFSETIRIYSNGVGSFCSSADVVKRACDRLDAAHLEILQVSPLGINFAGDPDAIEKAFRTKIVEKEVVLSEGLTTTCLDSPDTRTLGLVSTFGTPMADSIEGVALEVPRHPFSASPLPPPVDYWHLDVPLGVADALNATKLHELGITGAGVRVAMVDSGWFRHPFFVAQGYQVDPVVLGPAAVEAEHDESGHGTGESANIMAIAPGCHLLPVKASFVNTIGAFNAAVALQPDIITCSWGSHTPFALSAADMVLEASVAAAIANRIVVVFAAGNGHAGFPGQHPEVVSAGGVFIDQDGSLQAANYASGFASLIFPGRRVPDVCGAVGMRPKAIYIMLPVEPADQLDTNNSGSVFPDGDQTEPDDGWAAFSGTSAAAPQLAGILALMKQVAPSLSPMALRSILASTARDVVDGSCSPVTDLHGGLPAAPGPDEATGPGLADAYNAVVAAYVASLVGSFSGASELSEQSASLAAYCYWVADALDGAGMPAAYSEQWRGAANGYAALASIN